MLASAIHRYQKTVFSFNRALFYSDLADSFRRRVSLKQFATVMGSNAAILKNDNAAYIASKIYEKIENDADVGLEASIQDVVPHSDLPLLRAAEVSKNVPDSIVHLSKVVDFKNRLMVTLFQALFLLLVVLALSTGVSWMTADIIDQIVKTAPHIRFDGFNALVIGLTNFLMNYWKSILVVLALLVIGLIYGASRFTGQLRTKLDEWPLLSIYRNWHSANDIAALAMFLSAGLVLKEAINRLSTESNPWRQWQIHKLTTALDNHPNELLQAFSQGMFSPQLRARLAALAESASSFEDAIIKLGANELERIEGDISRTLKHATSFLISVTASVAIVLALGQNTIIIQLQNEFSKGF